MAVDTLEGSHARTTYRYLRIAMAVLLGSIAASVLYEVAQNPELCLQRSISAYYYTPVRAIFVSAVVALGVCLVSLRGNTRTEDAFLNLAGMFAPVVALVPTPNPGTCTSNSLFGLPLSGLGLADLTDEQRALAAALQDARNDAVLNNMTALLAAGAVSLLVAFAMLLRGWSRSGGVPRWVSPTIALSAVGLYGLALFAFVRYDAWFIRNGHNWAAVLMFVCIVVVVGLNGRGLGRKKIKDARGRGDVLPRVWAYGNQYARVAVTMVVSAGLIALAGRKGFGHWVFTVEATLLLLFLLFWVLQTAELWNEGLREEVPDESLQPSTGSTAGQPADSPPAASGAGRTAVSRDG